jgi:UDP-N-acetylglucosamine acyltransferase
MAIHPTACVDPRAEIDPSAEIGPVAVIDGPVRIGPGTRVMAHAVVAGRTTLGRDNAVHFGAVLGGDPQDLSYRGEDSELRIGDRNVFREHCEVHRGSKTGLTAIGDDNYLMSHSHVAHDCRLADRIVLATGATLGGHVQVAEQVFVSGNCVVHQYVRIGRLALLRGSSRTSRDVPPFAIMDWTHTVRGVNRIGLRRAGLAPAAIRSVQRAFAVLFGRARNLRAALAEVESTAMSDEVRELLGFIRSSERGVCFGPRAGGAADAES